MGHFKAYESVLAVGWYLLEESLDRERWTAVAYVYDKIGLAGLDSNLVSYYSRGAAAAVILIHYYLDFLRPIKSLCQ